MRRDAKADANQPEVIAELRRCGAVVAHTHQLGSGKPDFIVGMYSQRLKAPALLWVELKTDCGKLTRAERKFHREWTGYPVIVARTADEILEWFGYKGL